MILITIQKDYVKPFMLKKGVNTTYGMPLVLNLEGRGVRQWIKGALIIPISR